MVRSRSCLDGFFPKNGKYLCSLVFLVFFFPFATRLKRLTYTCSTRAGSMVQDENCVCRGEENSSWRVGGILLEQPKRPVSCSLVTSGACRDSSYYFISSSVSTNSVAIKSSSTAVPRNKRCPWPILDQMHYLPLLGTSRV